jgi:rhodanese-related sulfurtransferase
MHRLLTAAGRSSEDARETIRISLSTSTTEKDILFTLRAIEDVLAKRVPPINIVPAEHVNESVWGDPNVFILDVRFPHDKAFVKGIPGAREMPLASIRRGYHTIPRDKRVLVACQAGLVSPFVAMYLRKKGYTDVGIIGGGVVAWRMSQPRLRTRDTDSGGAHLNGE